MTKKLPKDWHDHKATVQIMDLWGLRWDFTNAAAMAELQKLGWSKKQAHHILWDMEKVS